MIKYFTFIMTSKEIGEVIDQFPGEEMIDAWNAFVPSACEWIIKQLPDAGVTLEGAIHEFSQELPQPLNDLNHVWLVDVIPDNCPDVIQVIVVGCSGSAC